MKAAGCFLISRNRQRKIVCYGIKGTRTNSSKTTLLPFEVRVDHVVLSWSSMHFACSGKTTEKSIFARVVIFSGIKFLNPDPRLTNTCFVLRACDFRTKLQNLKLDLKICFFTLLFCSQMLSIERPGG
jgi:hypothetical protein